jgi:hypothetical protein
VAVGGTIAIAPPDHHLLVLDHQVHLSSGPKVNRHRPSLDVMFTSSGTTTATSALEEQAALRRHLVRSADATTAGVDASDADDHLEAAERAADLANLLKRYLG